MGRKKGQFRVRLVLRRRERWPRSTDLAVFVKHKPFRHISNSKLCFVTLDLSPRICLSKPSGPIAVVACGSVFGCLVEASYRAESKQWTVWKWLLFLADYLLVFPVGSSYNGAGLKIVIYEIGAGHIGRPFMEKKSIIKITPRLIEHWDSIKEYFLSIVLSLNYNKDKDRMKPLKRQVKWRRLTRIGIRPSCRMTGI